MTTALLYDPIFLEHKYPEEHPESPNRVKAAMEMIEALGWLQREDLKLITPRQASREELELVHTPEYLDSLEKLSAEGGGWIDQETFLGPRSLEVAKYAAGAALAGVDAVLSGKFENGYVLGRPPGHHASADTSMGFCILNNVAIAARYATKVLGLERVLIVDYDVHHGNGTQDIFYSDPSVLYFSIHQAPYYPGTGSVNEIGEGEGLGTTCNVPIPMSADIRLYDPVFRQVLYPLADRFKPQLILVSAGYDAHWLDPLAGINLDVAGYAMLARYVKRIASSLCDGRMLVVQEGGYNIDVVARCAVSTLNMLMGGEEVIDDLGEPPDNRYRWNSDAIVNELRRIHDLAGFRRWTKPEKDACEAE